MKMADENENVTQEDGQIRVTPLALGGGGIPVWGDNCGERRYWSNLFGARNYDGSPLEPNPKGDNKRTCGDPYGWIDGPAGKPGTFYMACCSTGGYIAYSIAQQLMPEMCKIANDSELNSYVERVLFEGLHTQPDPCAPPDPRENMKCEPWRGGKNCLYYKKTWGPDPEKPGMCIVNGTNGLPQNGRFPHLHGVFMEKIYNEPALSRNLRDRYGKKLFGHCSSS
jgi:hypothetical protein